mmetsp:Transcript_62946/g.99957  ORF Transcript_62946/g.99957 Transcript_62946/m.99957 type:complete len:205 (+) Transcript_62946:140-754(+)
MRYKELLFLLLVLLLLFVSVHLQYPRLLLFALPLLSSSFLVLLRCIFLLIPMEPRVRINSRHFILCLIVLWIHRIRQLLLWHRHQLLLFLNRDGRRYLIAKHSTQSLLLLLGVSNSVQLCLQLLHRIKHRVRIHRLCSSSRCRSTFVSLILRQNSRFLHVRLDHFVQKRIDFTYRLIEHRHGLLLDDIELARDLLDVLFLETNA